MRSQSRRVLGHSHAYLEEFSTSALDFYQRLEESVAKRQIPNVRWSRVLWKEEGPESDSREYMRVTRKRLALDVCAAPFGSGYFFSWRLLKLRAPHPWLTFVAALLVSVAIPVLATWFFWQAPNWSTSIELSVAVVTLDIVVLGLSFLGSIPLFLWLLGWLTSMGLLFNEDAILASPLVGEIYDFLFNPQSFYQVDTAIMFQEAVVAAIRETINAVRAERGLAAITSALLAPENVDVRS